MQVEKKSLILNQLHVVFSTFVDFGILYSDKLQIKEACNSTGDITFSYLKNLLELTKGVFIAAFGISNCIQSVIKSIPF